MRKGLIRNTEDRVDNNMDNKNCLYLSNNQSSTFISNNLYFFDEYDISNKTRSKYSEKLKYLYEIFSDQLSNFYSSYSMVAQK